MRAMVTPCTAPSRVRSDRASVEAMLRDELARGGVVLSSAVCERGPDAIERRNLRVGVRDVRRPRVPVAPPRPCPRWPSGSPPGWRWHCVPGRAGALSTRGTYLHLPPQKAVRGALDDLRAGLDSTIPGSSERSGRPQ